MHPVFPKDLLKLDITNQPEEHDYDLQREEINSQACSDSPSVGVTVQDVLRTIHEDVRTLSHRCDWTKLKGEERAQVDATFRERCRSEEELSQGLCRIDYLRGRDRLEIIPKLSLSDEMLLT